jgi:TonB-dependent receptor
VPNTTVSYDATTGLGSVSQSNPGLKPNYTRNYDLSAEYYFEPSGVLSAGAFRKDIKDFIGSIRTFVPEGPNNGFGGEYAGFDFNTKANIGKAKIQGVELNYNQQFRFLPRPFNGLSLFANYTKLQTEGSYADGARELAGFVPKTYNVGLSYDWAAFQVRTTYHYKSAFLNNYSTDPTAQVYVTDDPTVDINVSYHWKRHLTVFVDVINVFNNSPDWYAISPQHVDLSELYGTRLNVGISGRF